MTFFKKHKAFYEYKYAKIIKPLLAWDEIAYLLT